MSQNPITEPTRREQVVSILADALLRILLEKGAAALRSDATKRDTRSKGS
jgi:hypothetical protein